MERIAIVGTIGTGALAVILVSGIWPIQAAAAVLLVIVARPFWKAVVQAARVMALRLALQQLEDPEEPGSPSDDDAPSGH